MKADRIRKQEAGGMFFLYVKYYVLKLEQLLLKPFRGIPSADFNNVYDQTIL